MPRTSILSIIASLLTAVAVCTIDVSADAVDSKTSSNVDPATWGDDHVGKPFPAYVTGDECLFCHRKIGAAWDKNRHQMTIRPALPDDPAISLLRSFIGGKKYADQTNYLIGSKRKTRFLKRSKLYGKLDLLSTSVVSSMIESNRIDEQEISLQSDKLKKDSPHHWDEKIFGDRCAGCHATAVDTRTRAFSALSLDCFTCHGNVNLKHTKDTSFVFLSSKNREPRRVISICGQCHLRGGKSRSSGLPYPNTFVAGDNLFRDFHVDFSDESIHELLPGDRHIYLNARDVAIFGKHEVTCLSCHDVHTQRAEKHQGLETYAICSSCHLPVTENSKLRDMMTHSSRIRAHSPICDY